LLRVPLIVKFPKSLYSGTEIDVPVRLIDVLPTILDFLKIKTDSPFDGRSLLGYLHKSLPEYLYKSLVGYFYNLRGLQKNGASKYVISEVDTADPYYMISVRGERYKYIYFPNQEKKEFFDLHSDPKELNNIVNSRKSEVEDFSLVVQDIIAGRKKTEGTEMAIDQKTIDRLKSLGYMQ
jgi:arylsulfatase A-like enzyme